MPGTVALIVPCHNEAKRLVPAEFLGLARARPDLSLVAVDDGSTDGTSGVLEELRRAAPDRITVRRLAVNAGKGEAVREGLLAALSAGARAVGYCDADFSTPPAEMARLVAVLDESGVAVVLGSRVRLLGMDIERKASRHYLGRVFATFASLALRLPVYDTQCGAKVFRASPSLARALERPFSSRWIFDIELIDRLLEGGGDVPGISPDEIIEVPLRAWRHVPGSKLRAGAMIHAGLQVVGFMLRKRLSPRAAAARARLPPSGPGTAGAQAGAGRESRR